jgi:hypothetical protein
MKDNRYDLGNLYGKSNFGHASAATVIVMVMHTRAGLDGEMEFPH